MKYWILLLTSLAYNVFAEETLDCETAWSTLAINQCLYQDLVTAEKQMQHYLAKSLEHNSEEPLAVASIQNAQEAWLAFRDKHCDAVYEIWRGGSISTAKSLSCKLQLTQQRTRGLWRAFLTYADSTPPVLPDPKTAEPESD